MSLVDPNDRGDTDSTQRADRARCAQKRDAILAGALVPTWQKKVRLRLRETQAAHGVLTDGL